METICRQQYQEIDRLRREFKDEMADRTKQQWLERERQSSTHDGRVVNDCLTKSVTQRQDQRRPALVAPMVETTDDVQGTTADERLSQPTSNRRRCDTDHCHPCHQREH
jgi:hypothetical protein